MKRLVLLLAVSSRIGAARGAAAPCHSPEALAAEAELRALSATPAPAPGVEEDPDAPEWFMGIDPAKVTEAQLAKLSN